MSVIATMPQPVKANRGLLLHLRSSVNLTDNQLFELCLANRELQIERTAEGDLIIMPPVGGETGWRNAELTAALVGWAHRDGTGVAFDSSAGFLLPNGAMRSPDAAWVRRVRLEKLTPEQKRKFIPLCPDFVVEIRSPTDSLRALQAKMQEYITNGAALGWLIDPIRGECLSIGLVNRLKHWHSRQRSRAIPCSLDLCLMWREFGKQISNTVSKGAFKMG